MLELVAHRVRGLVVPYEASGDEQPLRARLLAERGLLAILPESELTPDRLAREMDATLGRPGFPAPARVDLDGARRSVAILAELAAGVRAARTQGTGRAAVAMEAVRVADAVRRRDRDQAPRGIERHRPVAQDEGPGPEPVARPLDDQAVEPRLRRVAPARGRGAPGSRGPGSAPARPRPPGPWRGRRPGRAPEAGPRASRSPARDRSSRSRDRETARRGASTSGRGRGRTRRSSPGGRPARARPGRCCRAGRSSARCGSPAGS